MDVVVVNIGVCCIANFVAMSFVDAVFIVSLFFIVSFVLVFFFVVVLGISVYLWDIGTG